MARQIGEARAKIIEAAYKLFYRRGYARVGVDEIAAAAGVTKRTLYYHFQSKDDVLARVLEEQGPLALERIKVWTFLGDRDPAAALDHLFAELTKWISNPNWSGSGFTRLAVELADLPGHPARKIAHLHKLEVEATYREFLSSIGVAEPAKRARELSIVLEGTLLQVLLHGDLTYAEVGFALLRDRIARTLPV